MIKPTKIELYEWDDIVVELCLIMGISEDKFRSYHEVVGGEYKDLWHVCLESIVPDGVQGGSIVKMHATDNEWYLDDTEKWKNRVLSAWSTWCIAHTNEQFEDVYVRFSW